MAGFIKFDGIEGEATDEHYEGWSAIESFGQEIHESEGTSGSSRRRGGAVLDDLVCTKSLDSASNKIAEACLTGKKFPMVEVHLVRIAGDGHRAVYFKYEMENATVSKYALAGHVDGVPMDSFSVKSRKVTATYTEFDSSSGADVGTVAYSWSA